MGSLGSPNTITWVPYMNNRDCSQGFCSVYCPQWCYIIIPPPPPPIYFPDDNSFPNFSPLVVAIIGILASALLLVSYYTIISKYCGNTDQNRRSQNRNANEEYLEDNRNPSSLHEPWHVTTTGLDEALIKSITVCKYKKGDGLVDVTECSVCLCEFQENESIRLLPKCSHAFHIPCIDTWLKSHSNCPLCRANIVSINVLTNSASPLRTEDNSISNEPLDEGQRVNENVTMSQDTQRVDGDHQEIEDGDQVFDPKNPMSASYSDIGNSEERDTIIEIRGDEEGFEEIRRSLSMDNYFQNHVLVADILHMNHHEDVENEQEWLSDHACSSKNSDGEDGRCNNRKGVMRTVMDSIAVKRSFSSGRFFLSRPGRGKQTSTVPV